MSRSHRGRVPTSAKEVSFTQSLAVARQKITAARNQYGSDDQPLVNTFSRTQKLFNRVEARHDPICVSNDAAKENIVKTSELLSRYARMHVCGLICYPFCFTNVA